MPNIDYNEILEDLKDAVLGTVKENAQQFLDENKDARDFLEERTNRLAELGLEYVKAQTEAERESILERLQIVRQSMRTQLAGVALSASMEARTTFGKILDTAVGVMIKMLPTLVALI